jgi:antitoxin (DNA-binding transcriptional repressor) of toxin-antitoxin stability system
MVYNMTMKKVSVAEAKARLSALLEEVERGRPVTITRRNVAVAELRAVERAPTTPRPWGLAKGTFTVPDGFDAPLPADVLAAFEGRPPHPRRR